MARGMKVVLRKVRAAAPAAAAGATAPVAAAAPPAAAVLDLMMQAEARSAKK